MIQKEYNNAERYHDPEKAMKRMQRKQEEMLQRHYANYVNGKYVLWILPEIYHNIQAREITGSISVLNKDGSRIDTPYILRTPYPNKCIYQLSLKSGRKRLYGYPLIFDTFTELCNISEIQITWNIITDIYFSQKSETAYAQRMDQIMVRYRLTFEEHAENRFYTLYTKDQLPEIAEKLECFESYYSEYDIALEYDNDMIFYDEAPGENINIETRSLKPLDKNTESSLYEKLGEITGYIREKEISLEAAQEYVKDEVRLEKNVEMNNSIYYLESNVTLKPAVVADIDTAPCLGFAE